MKRNHIASCVCTALLALAPLAASAGSYDANTLLCSGGGTTVGYALNAVESAILAGTYTRSADKTNLLAKLAAANGKTLERKFGDAISKLEDISNAASALANAAKPKLDSAEQINLTVLEAQGCLTYPSQ